MRYIKVLLVILLLVSVTANAQKRKVFETVPEYLGYVKEMGVNAEKIEILSKEDFEAMGEDIGQSGFYTFYGVVQNSQLISAGKLELKSCWGQFRDLCAEIDSTSRGINIENISYLKTIPFNKGKKTIIFLYSYKLGKGHVKRYIRPILDGVKDDESFDYILLSLDTPDILNFD